MFFSRALNRTGNPLATLYGIGAGVRGQPQRRRDAFGEAARKDGSKDPGVGEMENPPAETASAEETAEAPENAGA